MSRPRIYFIGLHQGFRKKIFRDHYRIERRRRHESEAAVLTGGLRQTFKISEADVIFCRNIPERTSDKDVERIESRIAPYRDSHLIVNDIKSFYSSDLKDESYTLWKGAGHLVPDHIILTDRKLARSKVDLFKERYARIILRTNNESGGDGLVIIEPDEDEKLITDTLEKLFDRVESAKKDRKHSRVMAVEFIETTTRPGFSEVYRAHVVFDRVLSFYGVGAQKREIHYRDASPDEYGYFIELNLKLHALMDDPLFRKQIIDGVRILGNNLGAIDFLVKDGQPVFLELNPLWGATLQRSGFGPLQPAIRAHWKDIQIRLPGLAGFLKSRQFYRKMYATIAANATGGNG